MTSGKPSLHALWVFFPAAAVFAALAVPLSIKAVLSGSGSPRGLVGSGHGHELIFGFALALIAGYTLGPQSRRFLFTLLAFWLTARITWLFAPDSWHAQLMSPVFALILARYVVPRFASAKKWRNRIASPLILSICLLATGFSAITALQVEGPSLFPDTGQIMLSAILGLLLLMASAAIARYLAGADPFGSPNWLWLSASLWTTGYLIVALQIILLIGPAQRRRK